MSPLVPEVIPMIRALIARPSVSCTDPRMDQSNLEVIHLLAEWLESLGFAVQVLPVSQNKANLVARLGGTGEAGEGLVLAGHSDTVPFDEGAWSMDPFAGLERDGRLYGLGSCDMKAFFAVAIAAARRFEAKALRHPLTLLATADEESSMSGARSLLASQLRPGRYAVIGEPTGMRPVRMHKGVMMESIRIFGHAGHSSDPSLGANAIEGMQAALRELLAWRQELQARYRNPQFHIPVPTLNLGSIHGGDNPNRICAHCETQIDIRPLPGMQPQALRDAMAERLARVVADFPGLRLEVAPLFEGLPPFETPADATLVRSFEELTGQAAGSVAFGTEAPFLSLLGTETVVWGPGDIEQAHQPDEFLSLDRIEPTVDLLIRLIQRFCVDVPS